MKRILSLLALALIAGPALTAQQKSNGTDQFDHLYSEGEINASRDCFTKLTDKTVSICNILEANVGYRFNERFSAFVLGSGGLYLYNQKSTKNYDDQFNLGLGSSYSFKGSSPSELSFSVSSTIFNRDLKYCMPRIMYKLHSLKWNPSPYCGLGIGYLCSYNDFTDSGFVISASLGIALR